MSDERLIVLRYQTGTHATLDFTLDEADAVVDALRSALFAARNPDEMGFDHGTVHADPFHVDWRAA